jgi:predicted DNA-binding protein with PD1-like motif
MIAANEKFKLSQKPNLKLVFEEGESILKGIQNAMKKHKIKECKINEIHGKIKKAKIGYLDEGRHKTKIHENIEPLRMTGVLKLSFDDLYGNVMLSFMQGKEPIKGEMLSGIAKEDFEIIMNF